MCQLLEIYEWLSIPFLNSGGASTPSPLSTTYWCIDCLQIKHKPNGYYNCFSSQLVYLDNHTVFRVFISMHLTLIKIFSYSALYKYEAHTSHTCLESATLNCSTCTSQIEALLNSSEVCIVQICIVAVYKCQQHYTYAYQ